MKKKLAAVILAGCMIMTTACTKEVQQTPASTVEAEEIFSEAEASQEQTQMHRRTNVNNGNREHH